MDWISVTERLPRIQESVDLSNGYITLNGWIWDHNVGGVYFELEEEDERFMPLWWRPHKNSVLNDAYKQNTFTPKKPE